jgi:hypothetical protein
MKIKLFEDFHDPIRKWTNKILTDDRFYDWFDKNEFSNELKDGYEEYLSNLDDYEKKLSYVKWAKNYYNNL